MFSKKWEHFFACTSFFSIIHCINRSNINKNIDFSPGEPHVLQNARENCLQHLHLISQGYFHLNILSYFSMFWKNLHTYKLKHRRSKEV